MDGNFIESEERLMAWQKSEPYFKRLIGKFLNHWIFSKPLFKYKNRLKMSKLKKTFNPIIQTTTNYSQFKVLRGNRHINQLHLKRLKQSINSNYLITIILVNQRMEIIDGQHRFSACQQLGLPIHFIVVYGYGIREVQILNANMSNWSKLDYLDGYVNMGLEPYIQFKKFMQDFNELNFGNLLRIASGVLSNKSKREEGRKVIQKFFENGDLVIHDLSKSYVVAQMIMDYKPYFDKYNDNSFCLSLMNIFEHPNYDHKKMLHKLSIQPSVLIQCKTQEQYKIKLEEIFNYKTSNKVSLRY
jgi:hypothetical protein